MSATVQIVGNQVLIEGQQVAIICGEYDTTLRAAFVELIENSMSAEDLKAERDEASEQGAQEGYEEGVKKTLEFVRDKLEPLEDVERAKTICDEAETELLPETKT